MPRKSKRGIQRAVNDLEEHGGEDPPIVALELEDGTYVGKDGEPIHQPSEVSFGLPYEIWSEWREEHRPL